MIPYDTPLGGSFEHHFAPRTALTPQIVAHGGGNHDQRVLKGNPVGYMQHPGGQYHAYASARMEHAHLPLEHSMLGSLDLDHYQLGQTMPARARGTHQGPENRRIVPTAAAWQAWPDTSISSALVADPFAGSIPFGPGQAYDRGGRP